MHGGRLSAGSTWSADGVSVRAHGAYEVDWRLHEWCHWWSAVMQERWASRPIAGVGAEELPGGRERDCQRHPGFTDSCSMYRGVQIKITETSAVFGVLRAR